ncbi:hypothetical protein BDR26DRAFT_853739 [Obelidium mucronatum]|nr:hypothetical protein BDR26DRAFT_853739 [Obelidium mucronatum]
MGHFKWEGPNVSKSFTVSLDIGEMSIQTPLLVESLDLSLTTGGIKVANAVVTDKAVCNVNVGEVKGAFSGYKAMSVKSSLGGVTVDLVPGVDSVTSLQCGGLGEVKANVSGFEGRFSAQTSGLGSVSVKAPGGISQNTNPCRGVVGPNQEPVGLLDVKVGMGGCNIVFSS